MPRKPRKRPYSSKLGVPDSDHQISAAGVGAHGDVGEGQAGGEVEAQGALRGFGAAPVVEADQVGERLADQLGGRRSCRSAASCSET